MNPLERFPARPAGAGRPEAGDLLASFERFLRIDVANGDATPDTLAAYRREVAAWVGWCDAHQVAPAAATRADVEAYREDLKTAGAAVSTRQHKLSIVRRFYDAAVQHGRLLFNPAAGVKAGKDRTPPEEKIKAFTEEGLATLVRAVPADTLNGLRDRALLGLLALHGLRRVEVHRLDHESLDPGRDPPTLGVRGKGRKQRQVYLRPDTLAAVQAYAAAKAAAGWATTGALFVAHDPGHAGQRLSRPGINAVVNRYLEKAGLKRAGLSCHALRHTFATVAVEKGVPLPVLQADLGHADPKTTMVYVHVTERRRRGAATYLDVTLGGG